LEFSPSSLISHFFISNLFPLFCLYPCAATNLPKTLLFIRDYYLSTCITTDGASMMSWYYLRSSSCILWYACSFFWLLVCYLWHSLILGSSCLMLSCLPYYYYLYVFHLSGTRYRRVALPNCNCTVAVVWSTTLLVHGYSTITYVRAT
jgi:hypothetical protein